MASAQNRTEWDAMTGRKKLAIMVWPVLFIIAGGYKAYTAYQGVNSCDHTQGVVSESAVTQSGQGSIFYLNFTLHGSARQFIARKGNTLEEASSLAAQVQPGDILTVFYDTLNEANNGKATVCQLISKKKIIYSITEKTGGDWKTAAFLIVVGLLFAGGLRASKKAN